MITDTPNVDVPCLPDELQFNIDAQHLLLALMKELDEDSRTD